MELGADLHRGEEAQLLDAVVHRAAVAADRRPRHLQLREQDQREEAMSDDWIANFFDKCRNVSDREMQDLWARVLAGEANTPGSYSKRTVNFLTTLDSEEADAKSR